MSIEPLQRLINFFAQLPGVGQKTAQRYALKVISYPPEQVEQFANALIEAKQKVKFCKKCFTFSEGEICGICTRRDKTVVCVVKQAKDVLSMERVRDYKGTYHVLGGVLSPLDGIGPDQLNIAQLIRRIGEDVVKEIIVATNPDVEGEATAMYLAKLIKPLGVKVTRIAQGVSIGSDLEYADQVTLSKALESRREL